MTTVAVTGVSGQIGRALLERLDADATVERIVALDVARPEMPVAKLQWRPCAPDDPRMALALEGVDVLVHAALDLEALRDEELRFQRQVVGTRALLDAAGKAGTTGFVQLSTTLVYGAHADNPVPLHEDAPLRANPDYAPAYHAALVEELVAEFAAGRPDVRVAVLRSATPIGHRVDSPFTQHLESPRLVGIREYDPPVQFVHVDDLAAALHLAVTGDLRGAYNVATDGWLTAEEVATVLGKRRARVPEALAFGAVRRLWRWGLWPTPPGMLTFLMHPTVVSAARMHAVGWSPTRSNRELLRELAAERAGWVRLGPWRFRRRTGQAVFAAGLASTLTALLGAWRARRRR